MENKKFAFQFSLLMIIFSIIFYYFLSNLTYFILFLFLSALFFIGGILNLKFIFLFKVFWFKLALILSKIISPLIIGIIYFGVVFPTKIYKLIFIDFIRRNDYKNQSSYWKESKSYKVDFKQMY